MEFIFQSLDWPDLLGLLIVFLPVVFTIYFEFVFSFIRKFDIKSYRSTLSCSVVVFLFFAGLGSSASYFLTRYEGQPASLKLVWSAIDYSYGSYFILFLACIPVTFGFYRAILAIYERSIGSELIQYLVMFLVTIPSMAISYYLFSNTSFGNQIFGIPVSIRELFSDESFSLLNDNSPLRFTFMFNHLATVLTTLGVVGWLALIEVILSLFARQKEQKKEDKAERTPHLPRLRKDFSRRNSELEISSSPPQSLEEDEANFQELLKRKRMGRLPIREEDGLHSVDDSEDNVFDKKKEGE